MYLKNEAVKTKRLKRKNQEKQIYQLKLRTFLMIMIYLFLIQII